jgi:hypothetical protein
MKKQPIPRPLCCSWKMTLNGSESVYAMTQKESPLRLVPNETYTSLLNRASLFKLCLIDNSESPQWKASVPLVSRMQQALRDQLGFEFQILSPHGDFRAFQLYATTFLVGHAGPYPVNSFRISSSVAVVLACMSSKVLFRSATLDASFFLFSACSCR